MRSTCASKHLPLVRSGGAIYEHAVVIDKFRAAFGHTPLSVEEDIPWKCRWLVICTGTGALPVMEEVKREAHRRKIRLAILPSAGALFQLFCCSFSGLFSILPVQILGSSLEDKKNDDEDDEDDEQVRPPLD